MTYRCHDRNKLLENAKSLSLVSLNLNFSSFALPSLSAILNLKVNLTPPFSSVGASATSLDPSVPESTVTQPPAPAPLQPALDNGALTQSLADQLQALIENRTAASSQGLQMQQPSVALSDVLSPASLAPLFEQPNSQILASLQDYLPPDLPSDPSSTPEDNLRRVVQSAPFQSAVRQLDRAFATGLLGQLMPGFGVPEEAGLSVDLFLQAIYDKVKREQDESREG